MNKQNSISDKIEYPVRLVRYLSLAGIASRRKAFDIILSGKVSINNEIINAPSMMVTETDTVKFNNRIVKINKFVYLVLNKPKGYVCTNSDPHAKKKAIDLINLHQYRLFSAGRLDKNSEGLIIFTNDGKYSDKLMHPSNRILKTYEVLLNGKLTELHITEMLKGITDAEEILKAVSIQYKSKNNYCFILNEGKKREIRRLIDWAGLKVIKLKRVSIGNYHLNSLKSGNWRFLSDNDILKTLQI